MPNATCKQGGKYAKICAALSVWLATNGQASPASNKMLIVE